MCDIFSLLLPALPCAKVRLPARSAAPVARGPYPGILTPSPLLPTVPLAQARRLEAALKKERENFEALQVRLGPLDRLEAGLPPRIQAHQPPLPLTPRYQRVAPPGIASCDASPPHTPAHTHARRQTGRDKVLVLYHDALNRIDGLTDQVGLPGSKFTPSYPGTSTPPPLRIDGLADQVGLPGQPPAPPSRHTNLPSASPPPPASTPPPI